MRTSVFLLLFSCVPFISFSQSSPHIVSGINLNEDWTTLTNKEPVIYWVEEKFRKDNNIPGVGAYIDKDYLIKHADNDFMNIGFTDLILTFPQDNQANLEQVTPTMFTATLEYKTEDDYNMSNERNFTNIASILIRQFGSPSKKKSNSLGNVLEWNLDNANILLNINKDKHLEMVYSKHIDYQ